MRIAIAGPISVRGLSGIIDAPADELPLGHDGAPLLNTLIAALMKRGYEVSAYTLDYGHTVADGALYTAQGANGFRIYVGPHRPHSFRPNDGKPGRMLDMFHCERQALLRMIKDDNPDLVHAHWTYEYSLAAIESGVPNVITTHDSPLAVLRYAPNLYRLGRYFMARRVYNRAAVVTAVSPYLSDQVQRYLSPKISIIGNPIPFHVLENINNTERQTKEREVPHIAMVLNGWGRRKNAPAGLRSFSLLRRQFPEAKLFCFGCDYGSAETAERWAVKEELNSGVKFVGATPHAELLDRLYDMDLLLHPALEECCPLSLLEAMAVGIPVVGGDKSGGVPWVLDEGKAGMLTDISSPEAICSAMTQLLTNQNLYDSKVKSARDRIDNLFTPDAVVSQYESVYKQALFL